MRLIKFVFATLITTLTPATVLLTGCTVNPVTGESQLSIISPEQEVAIGSKNYGPSQQSQGGRYTVDPDLTVYVNSVGQKLAAVSDRPGLPYEFVVLNNDVPNAWALPGGKIAINRGLITQLEDESQLAAVLGHEIVHAAARHGALQMTQNMVLQLGVFAAGAAAKGTEYADLAASGASIGAAAWQARYGRQQELDADAYGMDYMARAGYDLQGAVELQRTFVKLSANKQSNWFEGLFASHPPSPERVAANQAKARNHTGGNRNRKTFQRAIRQLSKDQIAYDKHKDAVKAANNKNYKQALTLTKQAINIQPNEGVFWETEGHLQQKLGNNKAALSSYERAIKNNPEYYKPYLAKGLLLKKLENNQAAQASLLTSQKYLPTQMASYHLGELALLRNERGQAIKYFQSAAQGGGELGQAAQQKLNGLTQSSQ